MTRNDDRNRRSMSIEQLLVWAYRDQMVHQARQLPVEIASSKGPLAAYSTLWTEGTPIEASRMKGFDAADDAWKIHELVMKLPPIAVDCGHELAIARYHALGQYRGAEPPTVRARSIDKTGHAWPTNGMLHIDVRALVVINASKAARPDLIATPDFRYKAGMKVAHPRQKGGVYQRGWYQHVEVEGLLPGDVVEAAAIYRAWHEALIGLRDDLALIRLVMFQVNAALPPKAQ